MTPHLLHVLPGFAPGGTELRLAKLINAIGPALRHTILPLDGDRSAESALDPSLEVRFAAPPPESGTLSRPRALRSLQRALDPDVVITYNWGATDMLLGAMWGARAKFIHNECGFGPDEAERMVPRRVWMRRLLLRRAEATVVVSEKLLTLARDEFQVPSSRLHFIRTGVDTDRFSPGRNDELRAKLGIPPSAVVFGFTGGLRPEKNLPLLIDAFGDAAIENVRLILVGDGGLRPELEARVRERGLAGRVLFPGRAADPLPWYRAFDVFVMSSVTEQTSNAQLEAMACGLPCIVTDVGDCAALLERAEPWIVPSGDRIRYVEALKAAMSSRVRNTAARGNRSRACEGYSLPRMVAEYAKLWFFLAKKPVPAAILERSNTEGKRSAANEAERKKPTPSGEAF